MKLPRKPVHLGRYGWGLLLVWSIVMAGLGWWFTVMQHDWVLATARTEARQSFTKDLQFRRWASRHGGVYVPIDEATPHNPYLAHVPERDLSTPSGRRLTLMNPAYIMRQFYELQQSESGFRSHITSLKPLRPENAPDPWEAAALRRLAAGEREVSEVVELEREGYLRLMGPLTTEEGCLKCHAAQGYRLGDLRGGIAVAVPLQPLLSSATVERQGIFLGLLLVWGGGASGIVLINRRLRRQVVERLAADEAALASEIKYREIFNATSDAIVIHDCSARILDINDAMRRMFGFVGEDDPLACPVGELSAGFAPFRQEEVNNWIHRTLTEGPQEFDWLARRRDGSLFWVGVSLRVSEINGEKIVISAVRDIDERKRNEEALQQLRSYLHDIIDAMPIVLIALDREHRVMFWNRQAETWSAIDEASASGQPLGELLPDFVGVVTELAAELLHTTIARREKWPLWRSNEGRHFDLLLYPLAEGNMVLCIEDVSDRVHMEEMMVQTEKLISIGGLAAGMAHEINNPLGIVSQAAQNIEHRLAEDHPANRVAAAHHGLDLHALRGYLVERQIPRLLDAIDEATSRAGLIVTNMLNFSRQNDRSRSTKSLTELVDRVLELAGSDYDLKKRYDFRNIEIARDYQADLPSLPLVGVEIEQVILNLLKNAAHALAATADERPPRIVLRLRREDGWLVLEIEDNGPGMSEEVRRRVFEPFYTTKAPGVGTGLGLWVSYLIVTRNHHGQMEVEAAAGKGARFIVRLPLESNS